MNKWILAFILIQSTAYAESMCVDLLLKNSSSLKVNSFEASNSMSQKIRDNAHNYWEYVAQLSGYPLLQKLSEHQGLVVGDNHAGNFIFSPLKNEMRYFLADIKDSGYAPFIFDFNRLFLSTHASINKEFDMKATEVGSLLMDFYIMGLEGKQRPALALVDPKLQTSKDSYLSVYSEYVHSKYKKNKKIFKLKPGSLEPLESFSTRRQLELQVKQIFSEAQVFDYAIRPKERGGSKDLQRYWVLIEQHGRIDILEFKEIGEPATTKYGQMQAPAQHRYNLIMDTFWGLKDPYYSVVQIDQKQFETRRKKVDVISVPYRQKSVSDRQYLLELASLSAYQTGVYHSKTAKDLEFYLQTLKQKSSDLIKEMKELNKEYKDFLKIEIKNGRANNNLNLLDDSQGDF